MAEYVIAGPLGQHLKLELINNGSEDSHRGLVYVPEETLEAVDAYVVTTYSSLISSTKQGSMKADYIGWQDCLRIFHTLYPGCSFSNMSDSMNLVSGTDGAVLIFFNYSFQMYIGGVCYQFIPELPYPVMEQYGQHAGLVDPDPKQLTISYLRGLVRSIALTFGIFRSLYLSETDLDAPAVEKGRNAKKKKTNLPSAKRKSAPVATDDDDFDEEYDDIDDPDEVDEEYDPDFDGAYDGPDDSDEEEPAPRPSKRAAGQSQRQLKSRKPFSLNLGR